MKTFIIKIGISFAMYGRVINYKILGVCAHSRKEAFEYVKKNVSGVIVESHILAICENYCVFCDNEPDFTLEDGDIVFFN